jgi:hypothetical protein
LRGAVDGASSQIWGAQADRDAPELPLTGEGIVELEGNWRQESCRHPC